MTTVRAFILCLMLLTLALPPAMAASGKHQPADIVFRNADIYTMNAPRKWAESLAVRGDRIVYAGTDDGAKAFIGPGTSVVEMSGNMILPGFHDCHCHPILGGYEQRKCNLSGIIEKEKIFSAITAHAKDHPGDPWVTGSGWGLPTFPPSGPDRKDLDMLVPDRPAFFLAADGHSAWANSRALTLAGINTHTADPPGGRIERRGGDPSGTLRESAVDLVARHMPQPRKADLLEGLRQSLAMAHRYGITTLVEASAGEAELSCYMALEQSGGLTARVIVSQKVNPEQGEAQMEMLISRRARFQGSHLKTTMAKLFIDGVMESHTAAVLSPYIDRPGDCGPTLIDPAVLNRIVTALDREGFQVHVHAIGDRAVRDTLNAFGAARTANGRHGSRHHIAHLELIDPGDIGQFRTLGVLANFQPLWAFADTYIEDMTEPILGKERSRWLYPIGSMARSGAVIAAGSDWPVSSMNPLDAIQVAVTRQAPEEPRKEPWHQEQCIDLPAALAAYTINGAYLCGQDRETGSLETGKLADLIVLNCNLFTQRPQDINRARVLLTMVGGRVVYLDRNGMKDFPVSGVNNYTQEHQ